MRPIAAYYLFLLYILRMFRPVLPAMADTLSHSFALAIHIATVHAKYGSNHLEKELENTTSDNSKKNNSIRTETAENVYIPAKEYVHLAYSCTATHYPGLHLNPLPAVSRAILAPPPKFIPLVV